MKQYVLDTNILIESPDAIFGFDDNLVCITMKTLEELDGLKKAPGDTGFNARKAIRNINSLKDCNGNYEAGLEMENGGTFRIIKKPVNIDPILVSDTIQGLDVNKPDNEILLTFKASLSIDYENILITNDVSMQVKAELLGIKTQSYHNLRVNETGYCGIKCFDIADWQTIEELYKNGDHVGGETIPELKNKSFVENEYACLKCGNMKAYTVYKNKNLFIIDPKTLKPCNISAKNDSQKFALHALMAPSEEIPLVILKGPAGSAKTFLSLAAGVDQTYDNKYGKIVITRANVLADKDIGYLKGSLEDKMNPLLAPFYDNLEVILRCFNGGEKESNEQIQMQIQDMKESGILEVASLAYMRGRSLNGAFIIVDEVQNMSPLQVLTLVTRAGMGTKVVLCGDLDQIDAPNLDRENNALAYVSEKMKNSPLCAQITFNQDECVRSPLALEAAAKLTIR